MYFTFKLRQSLLCVSVFSLVAMLILLGASAKHGQFVHPHSDSHYLSKAVKMSQAPVEDAFPILAAFITFNPSTGALAGPPAPRAPFAAPLFVRTPTPLLI